MYEKQLNDFFLNKTDPIPHLYHEPILEYGEHVSLR